MASTKTFEDALVAYEALIAHPDLTPGPLTAHRGTVFPTEEIQATRAAANLDGEIAVFYGKNAQAHADADFAAASRTMGPALAAKARELKAENAWLRSDATRFADEVKDFGAMGFPLAPEVLALLVRYVGPASPTPGAVHPPTGEPFAIVGTEAAKEAISKLEEIADNSTLEGADLQACWDASGALRDVLSHRDHLAAKVTELQATITQITERHRAAEVRAEKLGSTLLERWDDAVALALRLDEVAAMVLAHDDPVRDTIVRVLKAEGKVPRSPETRALAENARAAIVATQVDVEERTGFTASGGPRRAPSPETRALTGEVEPAPVATVSDKVLTCDDCGQTPHRLTPSPEAGPWWRCSECGTATAHVDGIPPTPTGSGS